MALSFFLTVCVFCSLKVVFTHETTPRFTCAEFKKLEVGTVFKVKGDGRPYPPCRPSLFLLIHTHTHIHTDRAVNCQSNEWSRNVFQSSGGARTGLSSSHNNADIYASLCLRDAWTRNCAPRVLCDTTCRDNARRQQHVQAY